ncbi:MarR family winged helix-turn-helix transcriptional regulator [Subtercola endophyticus]|uniref:MarR family winged helix-turn-helix transcriptional regulator n=1 Tax=Subtercola endophyticus TaxID=2895559 RepID=UPI001E352113|nr:MarR family winged helix-turn-helix transcriptional regulator [Subtercola endophyticus]UFS60403.1 MarR family winged helix-turn-helix transcriptional regulator [Subtercola endophyticus]
MSLDLASMPTWVLNSAAVRSHQILQAGLATAGVNGYEFRCLSALTGADQLSQTDIGAAAALDPRDVTHTVRALESRGLVSRSKDPKHGRRQLVSLTPQGQRIAEHLTDVMEGVQNTVFRKLSPDARATLVELLEHVGRA